MSFLFYKTISRFSRDSISLKDFQNLHKSINENRRSFESALNSINEDEKKYQNIYEKSISKLKHGIAQLNTQVGEQLKNNQITAKMLSSVTDKLNNEGSSKGMIKIWDDVCDEMSRSCTELENKAADKREKDEMNVIVKTIMNKGSAAAAEIKNRIEESKKTKI